jgi:CcmD family protein
MTTTMTKIMMTRLHSAVGALALIVALLIAPATAIAQQSPAPTQPPPAAATDQFVPMDEIPEQDKLPAAPYLISAYAIAWLMLLFYVWSLWRRLQRVEDELKRLAPGSSRSDH